MIIDAILYVLSGVLNILLAPMEVINIGVDLVSGIPVVVSFLQVVCYIIPWTNILPLIGIVIAVLLGKILISLVRAIWALLPIL